MHEPCNGPAAAILFTFLGAGLVGHGCSHSRLEALLQLYLSSVQHEMQKCDMPVRHWRSEYIKARRQLHASETARLAMDQKAQLLASVRLNMYIYKDMGQVYVHQIISTCWVYIMSMATLPLLGLCLLHQSLAPKPLSSVG